MPPLSAIQPQADLLRVDGRIGDVYIAVSDESDTIAPVLFVYKRHLPAGRWGQTLLAARGVMFDESTHKSGGAFEQCLIVDDIHYLLGVEAQASPAGCGGFHLGSEARMPVRLQAVPLPATRRLRPQGRRPVNHRSGARA